MTAKRKPKKKGLECWISRDIKLHEVFRRGDDIFYSPYDLFAIEGDIKNEKKIRITVEEIPCKRK